MKNSVWKTFMELSLVRGIVPRTVFGLTAIAAIILIIGLALSKSKKRGRLHPLIVSLIAAVLAGAAGLLVAWLVSDVFMVFGVSLGWPVIFTIAGGIAGVGFVIAAAVTLRGVRRALAVVLVPLVLLSTALGVDSIYGEYQTIGTLVGYTPYASLGSIEVHKAAMSVSDWHSKARKGSLPSMPSQGKVLTVDIPNTESNFTARKAMIYLPPAALSDRPPALPVMELLAGQPGSPSRLIDAGNIAATMNAYAAKHDGLAPIVLVPDQNGEATHNSLCADTTQGNAETYLTTDVVNWAKKMLPVAKSARMWAMGGFSQGGTCTTQLVPRHPDIYGAMLPVDGELKPTNGSVAKMVQEYFAGDRKAYDEQVPVNAIAAALILADKTDVRRSRVRNRETINFDIHDRVNYAVERSEVSLDRDSKTFTLSLSINTEVCAVMDYFEIFLQRMLLCRKAAGFFDLTFKLDINGLTLL